MDVKKLRVTDCSRQWSSERGCFNNLARQPEAADFAAEGLPGL